MILVIEMDLMPNYEIDDQVQKAIQTIKRLSANHEKESILIYDEDGFPDDGFGKFVKALKKAIKDKDYHLEYDFWYDGCNYAGEDYVRIRSKDLHDQRRTGSCWAGPYWTFDDL